MTEADLPDDGGAPDGTRRRRSTFTPPAEQQDVPINLGESAVGPADTPSTPQPESSPSTQPAAPNSETQRQGDAHAVPPPAADATEAVKPGARSRPWDESVLAPPERRSLSDEEIIAQMGGADADSGELIAALEEQMALRAREQDEFDSWEALIRQSFPEDEADELVARGRAQFDGEPPAEPTPSSDKSDDANGSEPIVLPRWGDGPAGTAPEPDEALPPTRSFERVLVEDEPAPEVDAWPLAPAESQVPAEGETPVSSQQHGEDNQDEAASENDGSDQEWRETQVHVESLSVSDDPSGVTVVEHTEEVVSIRETIATRSTPEVPFSDVEAATVNPGSFDRVGAEPTPDALRTDRLLQLLWAWWAIGTPIPLVMLGIWLVDQGLSVGQSLGVSLLGALAAAIPLVVGTVTGARYGLPTLVSSRAAFGRSANVLPAALMLVVRLIVAIAIVWAASWVTTGVLVESNYWNQEPALIQVILVAVFALVAAGIAVAGRPVITVVTLVAAAGGVLGLLGLILLMLPFTNPTMPSAPGAEPGQIVAGISVVFSVLVVVWAHFGGDIARFQRPGSSAASGPSIAAAAAVVPTLILLALGALAGASDDATRAVLLADPFDTLLGPAPIWYPIPAIVVAAVPLIALAGLAVHSASYAVLSVGVRLPRYAAATLSGAVVAVGVIATVVFVPNLPGVMISVALVVGVLVAAWVGSYTGEVLTRRGMLNPRALVASASDFPAVRIAPTAGFVVSIGMGWGLITSSAPGLGWLGYLQTPFADVGVDTTGWQLGPLVALVLSLVVASLAGIRRGTPAPAAGVGA